MNDPIKQDYINYRIKNAKDALASAKLLAENSHWNASINRLYYACFYVVSALLYKNGIIAKKHSGLKHQFSQHFIKTGLIDKNIAIVYLRLSDWRQKGDYDDFEDFNQEKTLPLFEPVEDFIRAILDLIEK
ncbi:MAG: HEPN domain-containing protein [Bacteroidales bacterium]